MRRLRWMGMRMSAPLPPRFALFGNECPSLARLRLWGALLSFLVVCVFLLPTLYGCGAMSEPTVKQKVIAAEGASLTSSDGKVTLDIPPGALAEDTEIALSALPREDWTDEIREVEPWGTAYRLEPEGLEFLRPASLTFHLERSDLAETELVEGAFPVCVALITSRDGDWDFLKDLTTKIDVETEQVLVVGEVEHFSVTAVHNPWLAVVLDPASVERSPGDPWWGTITIQNLRDMSLTLHSFGMICTNAVNGEFTQPQLFHLSPFEIKTLDNLLLFECWRSGGGTYGVEFTFLSEEDVEYMEEDELYGLQEELRSAGLRKEADELRDYLSGWRDLGQGRYEPVDYWGDLRVEITGAAVCEYGLPPSHSGDSSSSTISPTTDWWEKPPPLYGLCFDPDPCDFQNVLVGSKKRMKVVLKNSGRLDAAITGCDWPNAPFAVVSTVPRNLTLKPNESYDYTVEFSPDDDTAYDDLMGVSAVFYHELQMYEGSYFGEVKGEGVLTEVGVLLIDMEGSWELAQAGELVTLDFQMALRDTSEGENPITLVNLYIDDLDDSAYSSGPISLVEFPPSPGMVFRRDVTPETHTVMVEVFTANGQSVTKTWEIDCSMADEPEDQECTGQPDCTCDVCQ